MKPPRIVHSIEKRPQPRFYRTYTARCEECGESVSTPAKWTGKTRKEILATHREWARQHRLEHRPGGRKFTAGISPMDSGRAHKGSGQAR